MKRVVLALAVVTLLCVSTSASAGLFGRRPFSRVFTRPQASAGYYHRGPYTRNSYYHYNHTRNPYSRYGDYFMQGRPYRSPGVYGLYGF